MYRSIYDRDLFKRDVDLYKTNGDVGLSLISKIICLTMDQLERKAKWLAFFLGKKKGKKELRGKKT